MLRSRIILALMAGDTGSRIRSVRHVAVTIIFVSNGNLITKGKNKASSARGGKMTISNIISIVTAIVSVAAFWQSHCAAKRSAKVQEEQVEMQKRITQIEEAREQDRVIQSRKAYLKAELRKNERGSYRLVIKNSGQGTARNVKATLDGKPILEHPAINPSQQEITLIGPYSEISYIARITFGCRPPFKFKVTWEDDSGEPGEYETTLTT